jgi:hypothetical protein
MMSWRNCDDVDRSDDATTIAASCRWFGFFGRRHAAADDASGKEFGIAPTGGFKKAFDAT